MFNFIKSTLAPISSSLEAQSLVDEFSQQDVPFYPFDLKNFTAWAKYQEAGPRVKCEVVLVITEWINKHPRIGNSQTFFDQTTWQTRWKMQELFSRLLRQKLLFTEQEILYLLNWSVNQSDAYRNSHYAPQMIKVIEEYLKDHALGNDLKKSVEKLINAIKVGNQSVAVQRWIIRLNELIGETEIHIPLEAGDVWADAALNEFRTLDLPSKTAWVDLLLHCLRATGSTPSVKWLNGADQHMSIIGQEVFISSILRWFPLVDVPRTVQRNNYDNVESLLPVNADILKGLVWLCSKFDVTEVARALTALAHSSYKKIPGTGPRAVKVGNACFWSLGNMPGGEGVSQLSILKTKIKVTNAQKVISNILDAAAKRSGMTRNEMEELSIPTYGLQDAGLRRDQLGDFISEIKVSGSDVEQSWMKEDGKHLSSIPKLIREKHPDVLKEISQAVKDIRKMLTVQRDRIDSLYLVQQKWTLENWRSRYIDHPLVGTIARRLIWNFSKEDRSASAIWFDGQMVGNDGKPVTWMDDLTTVELWHPIEEPETLVLEWRQWLIDHEIRQPFKQAYREVYLLTDAERNTRVYSNRYAAHILRQHQFNSLCAARGWRNSLRLMVDDEYPPARKSLPQWGLRAEYWIEGIGDTYGVDTNGTGTYLYLSADQVRFYRIDSLENRAHATGGGYSTARWNNNNIAEPLPLEEIPALVLSEIMRDVDMFVGVASIGNDPNWLDGGPEVRYRDYWHGFSFGDLTESAKTRKQVLETLIPRLKIAERCKLTDKFLVVRGDIRTYKIHLGSGNILMEPNDQYLCIVPARSTATTAGKEKLFIPFEGDQTLAIILSKAFLLAEDKKIKDTTITRQLKR